jgi:hypothetical protein
MKRVAYVNLLDELKRQARAEPPAPLEGATLPRKREATERLKVRLGAEHREFLRAAVEAAPPGAIDESAVVAAGLALLKELDLPWGSIASRDELIEAIRRKLTDKG